MKILFQMLEVSFKKETYSFELNYDWCWTKNENMKLNFFAFFQHVNPIMHCNNF